MTDAPPVAPVSAGRLLVVAPESPWPVNHGARVDIWNRYEGLAREGWSIKLICWRSRGEPQDLEDDRKLGEAFASVETLRLPAGPIETLKRLARMLVRPSLVAARDVDGETLKRLKAAATAFAPDAVVAEGVYCARLASQLARALALPLIVRSHNIEHRYMATQMRLARTHRARASIVAALLHLRGFEARVMREADAVLDISMTDAAFWRARGVRDVRWVPTYLPALDTDLATSVSWAERPYDAVYVGNLWAPNNVAALSWLIEQVMPHVRRAAPGFTLLIAGANPSPLLVRLIEAADDIQMLPNPTDAASVRAAGRVLVNPILEGSGLNTKSIEMLFFDSPLVMTPFAAAGMDGDTQDCFILASEPEAFARALVAAVATPFVADAPRLAARARFGQGGARALSQVIREIVEK